MGGLLLGWNSGLIAGVLLVIGDELGQLDALQRGLVPGLQLIGALAGAALTATIAERLGRRGTLWAVTAVAAIGSAVVLTAVAFPVVLVGEAIVGIALGAASTAGPLYLGELAPPQVHGRFVGGFQLAITVGILGSYLADAAVSASGGSWRLMVALSLAPVVLLAAGLPAVPASPTWLVRAGRVDDARAVLVDLHTEADTLSVEEQLAELTALGQPTGSQVRLRALGGLPWRPVVVVGVFLAVLSQITGINTIIFYTPTLLRGAGLGRSAALLANVGVGAVNVMVTAIAIRSVDRLGRRPLLIGGTAGMAVGMAAVALTFAGQGGQLAGGRALIAVVGLLIFVASFAAGIGPASYLLLTELFPAVIRSRAAAVTATSNWLANITVTIAFLPLLETIGPAWVFALFTLLSVAAAAWALFAVPETRGRSAEAVLAEWGSHSVAGRRRDGAAKRHDR